MLSKRWRRVLAVTAATVVTAGVLWAIPASRARIKAVGVLAEASGADAPLPWRHPVNVETRTIADGVTGDMYEAGEDSPVLLFVPGAARRGRSDPRVVRTATAFAATGRRVFVPELTLFQRTFARHDIERLVRAVEALSVDGPIGVVSFSYGGSFALIAASDQRVGDDVSFLAAFGAYFDLAHVIQGVTTGVTVFDGDEVSFETVPEASEVMISAAAELTRASYREELERALEEGDPAQLPDRAAPVYELLTNDDPQRTDGLIAELPKDFKNKLDYLSPSSHLDGIDFPVFIMQSKKDAATPWPEAVLLERALDETRLVMLEHFSHVDPPGTPGWLSDGVEAWRFVSWIVAEQE